MITIKPGDGKKRPSKGHTVELYWEAYWPDMTYIVGNYRKPNAMYFKFGMQEVIPCWDYTTSLCT